MIYLTIIVALKGKITKNSLEDGVVMTSDTQVSSYIKSPMQKVWRADRLPMTIGGSGSVSLSRYATHGLCKMSNDLHKRHGEVSCEKFEDFIYSEAEPFLRAVVVNHRDVIKRDGFGLIISFSDSKHVRLYEVQRDGIPMRMDHDPGYCCIGSGYITGGSLIVRQFYSSNYTLTELMMLASYMIFQVSSIDASVGGSIQMMLNLGGKAYNPKEDMLLGHVALRSEILKGVWSLLSNENADFEERFNKALKNGRLRELI